MDAGAPASGEMSGTNSLFSCQLRFCDRAACTLHATQRLHHNQYEPGIDSWRVLILDS